AFAEGERQISAILGNAQTATSADMRLRRALKDLRDDLDVVTDRTDSRESKARVSDVLARVASWEAIADQIIRTGKGDLAQLDAIGARIRVDLDEIAEAETAAGFAMQQTGEAAITATKRWNAVIMGGTVIAGLLIALLLATYLTRPLKHAVVVAQRIAAGKLD